MNFFSTKRVWRKVILWPDHAMPWMDFDAWAWQIVDDAADRLSAPLFFSRYTIPSTGEQRMEVQIKLDWTDDSLMAFFMQQPNVKQVSFAATDGSDVHAAAFAVSRHLRGKGEPLTKDVMHWMLNMTGYSYHAEIRLLCQEAAAMAANMENQALG